MASRVLAVAAAALLASACSHKADHEIAAPQRQATDAEVSSIADAIKARRTAEHARGRTRELTFGQPSTSRLRMLRSGGDILTATTVEAARR